MDDVMDIVYEQLLSEDYEDTDTLDEARIFLSPQGLKLKKQFKTFLSSLTTGSFFDKVKQNLSHDVNPEVNKKIEGFVKNNFDMYYVSPLLRKETTVHIWQNGMYVPVHTVETKIYYVAIKGNYMYSFQVQVGGARKSLYFLSFVEIDLEDTNISIDLAKEIIQLLRSCKGFSSIKKNAVNFDGPNDSTCSKKFESSLENLLTRKYPNLKTKKTIFNSVKVLQR